MPHGFSRGDGEFRSRIRAPHLSRGGPSIGGPVSRYYVCLRIVRAALNPGLAVEGILLTMADDRTNLSRQVEEEVRSHLENLVFHTVIPRNVRLGEAPSFGKPIILYDLRSAGAQSYLSLMREVVQHGTESTRARA